MLPLAARRAPRCEERERGPKRTDSDLEDVREVLEPLEVERAVRTVVDLSQQDDTGRVSDGNSRIGQGTTGIVQQDAVQ